MSLESVTTLEYILPKSHSLKENYVFPICEYNELQLGLLRSIFPSKLSIKEFGQHHDDQWEIHIENLKRYDLGSCLKKHRISTRDRERVVDQIMESIVRFNCEIPIFFKAVAIMDLYYSATET